MQEQPLVSIVSLLYDVKKEYVDKCIDSLLKQTYQNIEIIFVDDCSPTIDYSYIIELSPKIKLVRNKTNLGFNRNSQKSFELATGKYVVKVDSDDYIDPTLIEKEVTFLENNPEYGAVCCELKRFGDKSTHIGRPTIWSLEEALFKNMHRYGYEGGMMFKRELLNEISVDPQFRVCTDFDFHLQILEHAPIKSIHEILYFYRSHESNIMKTANKNHERINTVRKILEKHKRIYKQNHCKPVLIRKRKYF